MQEKQDRKERSRSIGKYLRYQINQALLRGETHSEISLKTGLTIEQIKKVARPIEVGAKDFQRLDKKKR